MRSSEMSDGHEVILVECAQRGCAESFGELVCRYQVPLVHFLRQRAANYHDAEDLTQEVFWRAYDQLDRYHSDYAVKTWLFTIAQRLLLNQRRRRTIACCQTDALSQAAADQPDAGRQLEIDEQRRNLWTVATEELTDSQFTAIWLFYVEQMTTGEIARVLGCTRVGVKTGLFRARRKLRRRLVSPATAPTKSLDPDVYAASLMRQLTMELDRD